jgi:ribosomal-protein-alanine N-acetyltransferase
MTLAPSTRMIETDRLQLRRMDSSDLDFFIDIHGDPDVARYIGAGNPRPKAETEQWFSKIQDSYRTADLGQLMVIRKADGVRVGRCGLSEAAIEVKEAPGRLRRGWFFTVDAPDGVEVERLPELGYTFGREYWGHGYASEAARCVYDYARTHLKFSKIMSVIHADNKASRAVVAKFAVDYIDVIELAGRPFERYHWPLTVG